MILQSPPHSFGETMFANAQLDGAARGGWRN